MDNKRVDSSDLYYVSSIRYEFRGVDKAMNKNAGSSEIHIRDKIYKPMTVSEQIHGSYL